MSICKQIRKKCSINRSKIKYRKAKKIRIRSENFKQILKNHGYTTSAIPADLMIYTLRKLKCRVNQRRNQTQLFKATRGNKSAKIPNRNLNINWVYNNIIQKLDINPKKFAKSIGA